MHNGSRHQSRRHWQQILLLVYDNKMSAPLLLIGMCAVIGLFSLQEDICQFVQHFVPAFCSIL